MFSGPSTLLILVVFISSALGQNATGSPNATTPSTALGQNATGSPNATTPSTGTPPPTTNNLPTEGTVTPAPSAEKTRAKLGVKVNAPWNSEKFGNKSSEEYSNITTAFLIALTNLYNVSGKYDEVEVSEVTLNEKDKMVFAEGKLSLVFKGENDDFIEDVFIEKVETGKLSEDLRVIKGSAEFKALGVTLKDWEAKEGECREKCDGAGGHFVIVRTCELKTEGFSCKGLKTTKESEDCVKYCPSNASSAAITVSTLILAIGIFFAFSFQ